jgi:hypothetical protein
MAKVDLSKELKRLKAAYSGMEDSQLSELAQDPDSLTEVAWQALNEEMQKRSLEPPRPRSPTTAEQTTSAIPPAPVMIQRYRDLPEASVAQSILNSAGIESFLADENLVRLDWFYSNLIGGIKLFVREEDADEARKLLEQSVPENFDVENVGEYQQPRCPQCGSLDVSLNGLNKPASYAAMWALFPIPIINKGWKCYSCGNTWQEPGPAEPPDKKTPTDQ